MNAPALKPTSRKKSRGLTDWTRWIQKKIKMFFAPKWVREYEKYHEIEIKGKKR